jgi:hypothetical protein
LSSANISGLRILVSAAEKNDNLGAAPAEIDAIVRAEMNAQFAHFLANALAIAEMAGKPNALDARTTLARPFASLRAETQAANATVSMIAIMCI